MLPAFFAERARMSRDFYHSFNPRLESRGYLNLTPSELSSEISQFFFKFCTGL
jgi:hypothetical protein